VRVPGPAARAGAPIARVVATAEAATLAAKSVTLTERLLVSGSLIELRIEGRYPNRVRIDFATPGVSMHIVIASSAVYLDLDARAWQSAYHLPSSEAETMAGRWFEAKAGDPALGASIAKFNPKSIERALFKEFARAVPRLVAHRAVVGGRRAIALRDAGGALYVASNRSPVILRLTSTLPKVEGYMEFSGYGASTHFALPVGATSLDQALAAGTTPTTAVSGVPG